MKPILLVVTAVLLYSIQNNLLEQKFKIYNPFSLLVISYLIMLPLSTLGLLYSKYYSPSINIPAGLMLFATMAIGLLWFVADACYIGAYTEGGNLLAITTIVILLPVASAAIKYLWVGLNLNRYYVLAWIFGALAVFLVAKGQLIEQTTK